MGKLPTVQDFGPRPVARPSRGIAQAGNVTAVGDATQALGRGVTDIGNAIFEREATAAATERDTYVSDQLRDLLYNPETGFATTQGRTAVDRRGAVMEQIDGLRSSAMEGLNATAQRKLEASIQRRLDGARQSVELHTLGERDRWLDGASSARVEAAMQDSLANPSATAESLAIIENETRARGLREGWGAERTAVELEAARSGVYVSQVERIAATDPIAAMEYMRNNEGSMRPSDLAAIEAKLQPEVHRAVGRAMGAAAAFSGVSTEYLASIRSAESGGNDSAKNPLSSATGRYQFIESTWREMMTKHPELGLTAEGRLDPEQQERAIRAFTADNAKALTAAGISPTNGNLYAAHFLGAGGARTVLGADDSLMVSNLVPSGVISANGFLKDMTVGDFKAWANRKGGGSDIGYSENGGGIEDLLEIQNPLEREAAINEYNLRSAVAEGEAAAELAAARDQAFQYIENGNMIDDLPGSVRRSLGEDSMSALRTYQGKVLSGRAIETDDSAYYELRQMQAADPEGFRSLNLLTYRGKLSDGDWQKFVDAQTTPPSSGSLSSASTLMGIASRQLGAAGIEDDKTTAALQSTLLRWQDEFVSQNNRPPTQTEIDAEIGQQLLPVLIDGPGMFGDSDKQETTLIQLQALGLNERQLAETSIRVLDTDVPAAVINEQIIALRDAGEPVTAYALTERILSLFDAAGVR